MPRPAKGEAPSGKAIRGADATTDGGRWRATTIPGHHDGRGDGLPVELDPNQRYDMPVVFGASPFPDVTTMEKVQSVSVPFVTERDALAELLPRFFEPGAVARVTVTHTMNRGVDYMGGRGYNIVRVACAAVFRGESETVAGPYAPVIWESDAAPIILGRERGGYAKIFGNIPDLAEQDDGCVFECYEYETRLLRAEVTGWTPVWGAELSAVQQATSEAVSLGWKYSPGMGSEPDADYPIRQVSNYDYVEAWRGSGTLTFDGPDATGAPYSSHIMEVLRRLPMLRHEPATMVRGSMKFPRTEHRRLR